MMVKLAASGENLALDEALGMALEVWGLGRLALDATGDQIPDDSAVLDFLKGGLEGLKVEAAVLDRNRLTKSKFDLLAEDALAASLAAYVGG